MYPGSGRERRLTGTPPGRSAQQRDPTVPHVMPPGARVVPPVAGVIVSLQTTAFAPAASASNLAPHVRGLDISVRPVGTQSPVKPLKANPSSGWTSNSTGSPVATVVEHSDPFVPHVIPALLIVPPVGFAIVSNSPDDEIQPLDLTMRASATIETLTEIVSRIRRRHPRMPVLVPRSVSVAIEGELATTGASDCSRLGSS